MVTSGDTSCLSPSSELVTVVRRPGLYGFIAADVIIAQLIVMDPQGLKKLQQMGEEASRTVSSVTPLPSSPTGSRVWVSTFLVKEQEDVVSGFIKTLIDFRQDRKR